MNLGTLLGTLTRLGLSLHLEGGVLKVKLLPGATPDPQEAVAVLAALQRHKAEVLALLKAPIRCPDGEQAEVGRGSALCRATVPQGGIPYQNPEASPPPVPSCSLCPWYVDNPWSHYPDLPKWCGWWWDYLLADSGQCRDRREGRVPDPEPGYPGMGPLTLPRKETTEVAHTCYECKFFDAGAPSPNPTQAWGFCQKLGKGRYGVARACDALHLAGARSRSREKACNR